MAKLFLLRHLKSQWNKDKEFAGWADNPLSKEGILAAPEIARKLVNEKIDVVYTSELIRNKETVVRLFEHFPDRYPLFMHLNGGKMQQWGKFTDMSNQDVPVYVSEKLNERYYGALQGLIHEDVIKKYGEERVHLWRRDYKIRPPKGESLKDVYNRAVPFFKKYILKELSQNKNVLVVASHNSLRAIVKFVEHIPDKDIANLELPFGSLIQYEFNGNFTIKR